MKTSSTFKRSLPEQKKKDWNTAIQRYNLPTSGIEVVIPGDYKPRQPLTSSPSPAATSTTAAKRKPFRYLVTRTVFIACGFATLGNIPVYSMITTPSTGEQILNLAQSNDPTSPAQVLQTLNLPAVALESYSGYTLDILPDAQQGNWKMHTITADDNLASALDALKISKLAKPILENAAITQTLAQLTPDSALLAQVVDDQIQQLIYAKDKKNAYVVSITDDGFVGKWSSEVLEIRESKVAFTVQHSLQRDAKEAGLSSSLTRQLTAVFHKDLDLKKDTKVGDRLGVIFQDYQYQGASIYTDKVLAAEYTAKDTTWQRVRFQLEDGKVDYFQPDGDSALKRVAFDTTPVAGARMSSGFGLRVHPVFGFVKSHTGIDFAAPHGTPIHVTADGSVKFIGQQNGYGNMIEVRHMNGISTAYGHMSGFNPNLAAGSSVKRGDVIGYVGSTGTSTGNHVHYEYRVNGVAQNPATADLPEVGILSEKEMHAFKAYASAMVGQLVDLRKIAAVEKPASKASGS